MQKTGWQSDGVTRQSYILSGLPTHLVHGLNVCSARGSLRSGSVAIVLDTGANCFLTVPTFSPHMKGQYQRMLSLTVRVVLHVAPAHNNKQVPVTGIIECVSHNTNLTGPNSSTYMLQ